MILRILGAVAVGVGLPSMSAALDEEPLEPEAAFPLTATIVTGNGRNPIVELRFEIHEGYYLYKDRFKVNAIALSAGRLLLPPGVSKEDAFLGKSTIYRHAAVLRLPLKTRPAAGEYTLEVTAQGCAENRICYAPFTQAARVKLP